MSKRSRDRRPKDKRRNPPNVRNGTNRADASVASLTANGKTKTVSHRVAK